MGIKRGVSLYSYQQTQFFKKMDWKDMIREVHDNLKTDGIEIIDEATIVTIRSRLNSLFMISESIWHAII